MVHSCKPPCFCTLQNTEDYECELTVTTERESFIVPVRSMGAAAALDLPDLVDFRMSAVKVCTKQTVLVRNLGSKGATFALRATEPFAVSPGEGYLGPGDALQVRGLG